MCYDNEELCKIWKGIDLSVQNWHEEFNNFWPEHSKSSKICILMGCFWPCSSFESTEELCLMALKIDTKFKGKLICASKKHPVQLLRWDAPRWLPQSTNFLELPPRSQIMPARSLMNKFSTPVIKSFYPRWYLEKLVAPTEIEYFQHGPKSSHDRYAISGFSGTYLNWPGLLEILIFL